MSCFISSIMHSGCSELPKVTATLELNNEQVVVDCSYTSELSDGQEKEWVEVLLPLPSYSMRSRLSSLFRHQKSAATYLSASRFIAGNHNFNTLKKKRAFIRSICKGHNMSLSEYNQIKRTIHYTPSYIIPEVALQEITAFYDDEKFDFVRIVDNVMTFLKTQS